MCPRLCVCGDSGGISGRRNGEVFVVCPVG